MHSGIKIWTVAAMSAVGAAGVADQPRIVNMGVPPGATMSAAWAVSADGAVVAGRTDLGEVRWRGPGAWDVLEPSFSSTWWRGDVVLNADGSVVAGFETGVEHFQGFRWIPGGGREYLDPYPSIAQGISADGSVIVGAAIGFHSLQQAVRWTSAGMQQLGTTGTAYGVSADGTIIVGGPFWVPTFGPAWRWTEAGGLELLPLLPGSTIAACWAQGISGDGSVIGGYCGRGPGDPYPVIWTSEGIQELPRLRIEEYRIHALSDDGSVIVGTARLSAEVNAVIWTGGNVFLLSDYLEKRGVNLSGWVLTEARGISALGDVIVGEGTFNGQTRGWIAYLSGCYANCDGSTVEPVLNVDDFTCFINAFAEGMSLKHPQQVEHYANCDGSTVAPVLSVDDFTCFVDAFAAGCR